MTLDSKYTVPSNRRLALSSLHLQLTPAKPKSSRYVFSRPKRPEILTAPSAQILLSGRTLPLFSKVVNLPARPQGTRSYYAKLLHERHWTIGHNHCKKARTASIREQVLTCTLCRSDDRASAETYDHMFRLCPHPLLQQDRMASNILLNQLSVNTDLK